MMNSPADRSAKQLSQFHIGPVAVAPNLILAPMSGVTSIAFRRLIRECNPGAIGLVVTEFISIEGITRGNEQSLRMMEYHTEERPIAIQIFGHEISRMVEAAKIAEARGADIIDINSGCPVPKVVKKGGGCELMRQPEHLREMLTAVRGALKIPLTLKIRAGWDLNSRNAPEIARMAEDCGIAALAVHGRTRQEQYRGLADWELIAGIAAESRVPVIGSGDVVDGATAAAALRKGVAGCMIGRGALANPWVFSEIRRAFDGLPVEPRPDSAVTALLFRYRELLLEHGSERAALGKLKQLTSQVSRRIRGSAPARRALCTAPSLDEFTKRLAHWHEALLAGRPPAFPPAERGYVAADAGTSEWASA